MRGMGDTQSVGAAGGCGRVRGGIRTWKAAFITQTDSAT